MRRPPILLPALAALLTTLPPAARAQDTFTPGPVKTTTSRCGAYTVQLRENGFGDPQDSVSLLLNGRAVLTLKDEMVGRDHCGDLTGDGVPEVILTQFSGGAHCCTTVSVYSLTTPPRRILHTDTQHSGGVSVVQLDGRGPKELVTGDWRFAYAYDLSFADSPALPLVYSYRNGQYVNTTREYPQYLLNQVTPPEDPELASGTHLFNYAVQVLAGRTAQAEAYVRSLTGPDRAWLDNYLPDIRQNLSSAGLDDWPQQTGVPLDGVRGAVGGAFTTPGKLDLLAAVREPGGAASLRLYRQQAGKVTASGPLLSFPSAAALDWPLGFTVPRADGRADFVLNDTRSGSVRYPTYRVTAAGLQERTNDPLAAAVKPLAELSSVARHRASLYRASVKTGEQRQVIGGRIQAAVTRAAPWLGTLSTPEAIKLSTLGNFTVNALEVTRENAGNALIAGTVDVGHVEPDQDSEYVLAERYTLEVFVEKRGGTWTVTRWQLTPRTGPGPLYRGE